MTSNSYFQILFYVVTLIALAKPLGWYMARVYEGESVGLNRLLAPVERLIYRLSGVNPKEEMRWTDYAIGLLVFNLLGALAVFALQRLQAYLPFNPQNLPGVSPDSAFNTAVSFATNTNWQGYGGETTMSYLTQMLGLTVQNFVSAATGMAVLVALIRGFTRRNTDTIGNFWVDLTRSVLYILMPLSLILALVLVGQGVVQTFSPYQTVPLVETVTYEQPKLGADGQALQDAGGKPVMETGQSQRASRGGRASGFAGGHQATRHQRRRLFQRQLGASVGKSDAVKQFSGNAVDTAYPWRAVLHLRHDGGRHPARLGDSGGDDTGFCRADFCYGTGGAKR